MFANLEIFQIAGQMANHAALRQKTVAQNIANADTPGYRQMDIMPFAEAMRLGRSRMGNRQGDYEQPLPREVKTATPSPNGNTVSLEGEILKTAQIKHQHETALAVYRSSMTVLRSVLSTR